MNYRPGDEIADTFIIRDSVNTDGATSVIRKAYHKRWDTELALKYPNEDTYSDSENMDDFLRECDTWISLGYHPNIVTCYYATEIDRSPVIVTEWIDGGSLKDYILSGGISKSDADTKLETIFRISLQIL